ncbi:PIR protein [Plasmodium yoelii yoelii]|nr:PIR protein [Plasmodium yoelii yoelii]
MCGEFESIWKLFPDDLNASGEYSISGGTIKNYCPKKKCDSNVNKIHAGCLWLFKQFYGSSYNFSNNANGNMNVVVYIMIWLSHKLNKMLNTQFSNLNEFYSKHMQNTDEYKNHIDDVTGYTNYIDLINQKKELMNINISVMSKFYGLLKILCNMHINVGKKDMFNTYSECSNKFIKIYNELNEDSNYNENSSYNKIMSILSNDYNDLKGQVKSYDMPTLQTKPIPKKKTQMDDSTSGISTSMSGIEVSSFETQVSDSDSTSSSSSILNKLISIPFIFVATLILLGIAYKYSLFGFRKRSQKQYLREKIKNIKNKTDH